jgi:cytidylate kinase
MEEAAGNGKESSHSALADRVNEQIRCNTGHFYKSFASAMFEVLRAVLLKIADLKDTVPCQLVHTNKLTWHHIPEERNHVK